MPVVTNRIEGFDLARALAVMGMVVVNFASMMKVDEYPMIWLGTVVDFIYGRAATVFVILTGISLCLMAGKRKARDGGPQLKLYLLKRSLLLLVVGSLLSFIWEADILHVYALFLAAGVWLSDCSMRALRRLIFASTVISIPVSAWLTLWYDFANGDWFVGGQHWSAQLFIDYFTSRYYPFFPWITYFLFGLLLGRLEMADRLDHRRWAAVGAVVCISIEVFSAAMMAWVDRQNWDIEGNGWIVFLRSEAFPVTPLFMFSSGAGALCIICLCRLALERQPAAQCLAPVLAFGRLSLTVYVAHLLFGYFLTQWIVKNSGTPDAVHMLNASGFICWAGICASAFWLRCFRRGPLESVFHRLAGGGASGNSRHRMHAAKTTLPDQVLTHD